MLAPKGVLSPKPFQQTSKSTLAPLWSFEEKYIQAKPFYLTHCVYPTVAAVCQSALIERKTKKKNGDRQGVSRGARKGALIASWEFNAHFSIAAERDQRPAVYISCGESLPFALKCYIGFPPVPKGAAKWACVCYRIKPPDHSYHEHNRVYSERAQGRAEWMWQQIEPASALSKALWAFVHVCLCVSLPRERLLCSTHYLCAHNFKQLLFIFIVC